MPWTPLTWTLYATAWRVCRRLWRWLYRRVPVRVLPPWEPGRLDLGRGWTLRRLPAAYQGDDGVMVQATVLILRRGRWCWGSTPRLTVWQRSRWSEEN